MPGTKKLKTPTVSSSFCWNSPEVLSICSQGSLYILAKKNPFDNAMVSLLMQLGILNVAPEVKSKLYENTEVRYNNALFFIKLYTADEEKITKTGN